MLVAMGIFLICLGAWFAGAAYAVTDNPRPMRAAACYFIAISFMGLGVLLVTGI